MSAWLFGAGWVLAAIVLGALWATRRPVPEVQLVVDPEWIQGNCALCPCGEHVDITPQHEALPGVRPDAEPVERAEAMKLCFHDTGARYCDGCPLMWEPMKRYCSRRKSYAK